VKTGYTNRKFNVNINKNWQQFFLRKTFIIIQTNSLIIFTCPNPVLLVPGVGQVG
jgi:hypothetical protein